MDERGYQLEYSVINEKMHSRVERQRKAETMRLVLSSAIGERWVDADVLNLGCSTGLIDAHLAPHVRSVTGVDIDEPGINAAKAQASEPNVTFQVGDAMNLQFPEESFDVVICSQVYEHVPSAVQMMAEIDRVLRPGGVCYFAATNRWAVMERHHFLPFLSWLPSGLADRYLRVAGKGERYYERHLGVAGLRRITHAFRVEDWTGRILLEPESFAAEYMFPSKASRAAARVMYRLAYRLFPGFIWLLWKRQSNTAP
ncbi:class I SAM-dependent methyltransferase [Alkalisalibacterium limincola]|uniref:Class I SAM-dependent methyltransferase n=1 Tax=Alkalisalibacterium limincola TaxID=2699169 RepID=A0A5C8KXA6_9GAMM|nr:class I SAM-dependent methyltransferase [Alkalisalibacterium limincola]TXK65028.1 class I SAM-dependent methyltransferase [Alkalisalibacterium limincola]